MTSSFAFYRCVICLGDYKEKEVLRIIPYCGHTFHLSCIDIWLRKQSTCPVCRLTLHNVCEEKHGRPVGFTIRESLDESNSSEENEREVEGDVREIEWGLWWFCDDVREVRRLVVHDGIFVGFTK